MDLNNKRMEMGWDMHIGGINKLSLLDYPDKMCCTIFTVGCNYCCPFCHNSSLVQGTFSGQCIDFEEIIKFLRKRQGLLDGVCMSGGEPLLQIGLESFLLDVKALGFSVKIDTNGSNPQKLRQLIDKKLVDYVAMDVKNAPKKYGQTVGLKDYELGSVKDSIALLFSGRIPYEFRTTVVREFHTSEDILLIAQWIEGASHYYLQKFVDSGNIVKRGLSSYSKETMQDFKNLVRPLIPSVELRGV